MKKCLFCNAQMGDDDLFCSECGKEIPHGNVCARCGAAINEGDKFCENCGARIEHEESNTEIRHESPKATVTPGAPSIPPTPPVPPIPPVPPVASVPPPPPVQHIPYVASVHPASPIVTTPSTPPVPPISHVYSDSDIPEEKHSTLKWIIISLIALALIGGGVWFFLKWMPKGGDSNFETSLVSFSESVPSDNWVGISSEINVDYPISGSSELKDGVIAFILKTLNDDYTFESVSKNPHYDGDTSEGQAVVDFYGKTKIREFQAEGIGSATINIRKELVTNDLVSYKVDFYGSAGGVGIGTFFGVTFNKADGEIVQVIESPNDPSFKSFLVSYARDLKRNGNIDFEEEELEAHPYPRKEPYITKDGVCFIYQKYEIGYGAMGSVEFTIPFDKIQPYMSENAWSLVKDGKQENIIYQAVVEVKEEKEDISENEAISAGLTFRTFTIESIVEGYNDQVFTVQLTLGNEIIANNLRSIGFELLDSKTETRPDYTGEEYYDVTIETYSKTINGYSTTVKLDEDFTEIHFPNMNDVEEFKETVINGGMKDSGEKYVDNEDVYWCGTDVIIKGTVVTLNYRWEP